MKLFCCRFVCTLSLLIGLLTTVSPANASHYLGYEAAMFEYISQKFLNSRIYYGHLSDLDSQPKWSVGWETGLKWIRQQQKQQQVTLAAVGVDGLASLAYTFYPGWSVISQAGMSADYYEGEITWGYRSISQQGYLVRPLGKVGVNYRHTSGLSTAALVNYYPVDNKLYGSLQLKYFF